MKVWSSFGGKMQYDRSSLRSVNKGLEKDVLIRAADFKYPTLRPDVLKSLDIASIAEDDCILFHVDYRAAAR